MPLRAQPTAERRAGRGGLVCLGAGAGLIRSDLREVRGSDVASRSGGVVVTVRCARPRTVPVLTRYHAPLLAAARFAGNALVCGSTDPGRRNVTNPLISTLDGGAGLPLRSVPRSVAQEVATRAAVGIAGPSLESGGTLRPRIHYGRPPRPPAALAASALISAAMAG